MSKTRIFALLGVVILLAAVFTNPSKEKINDKLTLKAKEILKKQMDYKHQDAVDFGMMLIGDQVVNEFVNNYTYTENYYIFSLTRINWNDILPQPRMYAMSAKTANAEMASDEQGLDIEVKPIKLTCNIEAVFELK